MTYETIELAVEDGIATLTLSRPDKMNALTAQMVREIVDACDVIDADDSVRAVIFTGAGRAYCAGADISGGANDFLTAGEDSVIRPDGTYNYTSEAARDGGGLVTLRLYRLTKPVIGAINGVAVGIGATMTLPMDIRLAAQSARFGFVFVRRGIVPEAASSWFLPRVVGISKALEWCYSGKVFPAEEGLAAGLVSQVLPGADLLPAARAIAREIADNAAPVSVALTRQMLWRGLGMSHPMEAHRIDSRAIIARSLSADAAEGVASFFEKRAPRFDQTVSADMPDFYPWWDEPGYA